MAGTITRDKKKKKKKTTRNLIRNDLAFNCVLAALKRWCPPAWPVKLVIKKLPDGILGGCLLVDDVFIIRLSSEMGPPQATEVLAHEWAHALGWDHMHARHASVQDENYFNWATHDESWGCAYSRTYRAYQDGMSVAKIASSKKSENVRLEEIRTFIQRGNMKRGWAGHPMTFLLHYQKE